MKNLIINKAPSFFIGDLYENCIIYKTEAFRSINTDAIEIRYGVFNITKNTNINWYNFYFIERINL